MAKRLYFLIFLGLNLLGARSRSACSPDRMSNSERFTEDLVALKGFFRPWPRRPDHRYDVGFSQLDHRGMLARSLRNARMRRSRS